MYLPEPYVLSTEEIIHFKLELLNIKEGELLVDLGCGDANALIKASELYKTKGVGYELREEAILIAKDTITKHQLENQITIYKASFLNADVSQADALILYLTRQSLGELSL
ncbi:MAG: class I SAM-dependent methyltransferase, partial [Flavobacteriaceae bacterium]|nr:class I SAM-dependent methyltransferase [Flavobacteriaceae bacterium]